VFLPTSDYREDTQSDHRRSLKSRPAEKLIDGRASDVGSRHFGYGPLLGARKSGPAAIKRAFLPVLLRVCPFRTSYRNTSMAISDRAVTIGETIRLLRFLPDPNPAIRIPIPIPAPKAISVNFPGFSRP
jgi:hypothetical protein